MSNQSFNYITQKGDMLYLEIAKKVVSQVHFTRCSPDSNKSSTRTSTNS